MNVFTNSSLTLSACRSCIHVLKDTNEKAETEKAWFTRLGCGSHSEVVAVMVLYLNS